MLDLGEPMFDAVLLTAPIEHVRHVSCCRTIGVAWRQRKLDAVVGEHRVDPIRDADDSGIKIPDLRQGLVNFDRASFLPIPPTNSKSASSRSCSS
jgi:hypothetical protein